MVRPSANFSRTLPTKPSQTTISNLPSNTSRPSAFPIKFNGEPESSVKASLTKSLPLASSSPIFKRPTLGFSIFKMYLEKTEAMIPYCNKCADLHFIFAPASITTHTP